MRETEAKVMTMYAFRGSTWFSPVYYCWLYNSVVYLQEVNIWLIQFRCMSIDVDEMVLIDPS